MGVYTILVSLNTYSFSERHTSIVVFKIYLAQRRRSRWWKWTWSVIADETVSATIITRVYASGLHYTCTYFCNDFPLHLSQGNFGVWSDIWTPNFNAAVLFSSAHSSHSAQFSLISNLSWFIYTIVCNSYSKFIICCSHTFSLILIAFLLIAIRVFHILLQHNILNFLR